MTDSVEPEVIENFMGVYLLANPNPKYKGRIYIGKTTDPNRRIKQHNLGKHFGGAWKTSNKGPWDMVLIVHGFPNDISALRFEWAWQHPNRSRRLQHIPSKKSKETNFSFHIRVLREMLHTKPWQRLPLVLRWLKPEYMLNLKESPFNVPNHMSIVSGPVLTKTVTLKDTEEDSTREVPDCNICNLPGTAIDEVTCLNNSCPMSAHIICLAKHFLRMDNEEHEFIPIGGRCTLCNLYMKWGDIIRKMNGLST